MLRTQTVNLRCDKFYSNFLQVKLELNKGLLVPPSLLPLLPLASAPAAHACSAWPPLLLLQSAAGCWLGLAGMPRARAARPASSGAALAARGSAAAAQADEQISVRVCASRPSSTASHLSARRRRLSCLAASACTMRAARTRRNRVARAGDREGQRAVVPSSRRCGSQPCSSSSQRDFAPSRSQRCPRLASLQSAGQLTSHPSSFQVTLHCTKERPR